MILKNYYWVFEKVLSEDFCNKLITHGNNLRERKGTTGDADKYIEEQLVNRFDVTKNQLLKEFEEKTKKKRDSDVAWIDEEWLYEELWPYLHTANKNAEWNFEVNHSESVQFTKYKINQFYNWHPDSFDGAYENPKKKNFYKKIRKLSMCVNLSDPCDYQGGELEFQFRNKDDALIVTKEDRFKPKGSVIVFPSFVWHRITPVTQGTRYSLVSWFLGYPFK